MSNDLCPHRCQRELCSRCVYITDAAKRIADAINLAITFNNVWDIRHAWMAFTLADGTTDHVIYPTRAEAIRHQSDEFKCAYFCLGGALGGAKPLDCQLWLNMHRQAYDRGMRLEEPKAPQLIVPTAQYDRFTERVRGRG